MARSRFILGKKVRSLLLIVLLVLTLVLMIFPMRLTTEVDPYESVFGDMLISYLCLLFLWTISFALCWINLGSNGWKLLLAVCFVMVYMIPLVINAPYGTGESVLQAANPEQVFVTGGLTPAPQLTYLDYPGLFILSSVVSQIFGLTSIAAARILIVVNILMMTFLIFELLRLSNNRGISNNYLVLGVLLAFEGNIMLPKIMSMFHADALGIVFYVLFLVLLIRSLSDRRMFPLCVIVLSVVSMTHFVSSFLCIFTLIGSYALIKIFKQREPIKRLSQLLIVSIAVFGIWNIWYVTYTFGRGLRQLLTNNLSLEYISKVINANAGAGGYVPGWVVDVRVFWILMIYAFGGIVALVAVFPRERRKSLVIESGGLFGLIAMTLFLTIYSSGSGEFYRFIMYGIFFTVPAILYFLTRSSTRRIGVKVLAIITLVLIFPTFVSHNTTIIGSTIHPSEIAPALYLRESFNRDSRELMIFGPNVVNIYPYYFPYAVLVNMPQPSEPEMATLSGVSNATQYLYNGFVSARAQDSANAVFIFSFKDTDFYEHLYQLDPNSTIWISLRAQLATSDRVYDDEYVQCFG